ncbi:hypothetical protein HOV93_03840 [Planctomycetes bacterium FF15]|uniref:Uncharacterized protein n=2 Tax=Bremerella alba TaxID=980252 RepID=A0A7V8V1K1_9BACT|nr:hypothetical protein [Bremerella alba]
MTVALAILSMVYSYGVCPGGCLEENQWYAAMHHLTEHDQEMPSCAHEHTPEEHCDCDQEDDSALLVSARTVDSDASQVMAWLPSLDQTGSSFTLTFSRDISQSPCDSGPPTRTLRAQSQLFRC